ncbi:hypothetical protein QLX08_000878 [Tetragonisca angustula]|uniref:Uncharacterized protein n=1 Tax=Tetragonisca angustula TaxID=166442 RepID=A0AAW1AJY9_9HYME
MKECNSELNAIVTGGQRLMGYASLSRIKFDWKLVSRVFTTSSELWRNTRNPEITLNPTLKPASAEREHPRSRLRAYSQEGNDV